jgi:hypothetical protein
MSFGAYPRPDLFLIKKLALVNSTECEGDKGFELGRCFI